ncbi:hypothetical protein M9458_053091 [Cirrhinus mrigala]|uniref:Uncharacterized protein n=1 Tax=Cirrhinus mrigala TaxID=683832 RepID=A0ABD0MU23_CIRMR
MFALALLTCIMLRAFSAQAKVVMCFEECKEIFYRATEPIGMDQNAKKICQKFEHGGFYYATLYSVSHRIPLYSAYTFDPSCSSTSGRTDDWHVEPQDEQDEIHPSALDTLLTISQPESRTEYMVLEKESDENIIKKYQAISSDYSDTGYVRGHLNPSSFQCKEGRKATFTLTNAAPVDVCFSRAHWKKWESTLKSFLKTKLDSDSGSATVYIVTGTVIVANVHIIEKKISEDPEKLTVPSHIWTAVCYKHHTDDKKSFSFGYVGENQPEGVISLMSVADLNKRLSELSKTQPINIFVDDCFGDNNKLNVVQGVFDKLINLTVLQQNTLGTLRRAISSGHISSANNIEISKLTVELTFDSMDTYLNVTEELKKFAGLTCLITNVHDKLKKRDVSKVSNAVNCLLVPEKQSTAADGSLCSTFSDSSDGCKCNTQGVIKPCCSTPCLYQDNLNSYRCYSGRKLIPCSPQYSLITAKGERCLDGHPCAIYDKDYYWCNVTSSSSDHCSPPPLRSTATNEKCIPSDCYTTVTSKTCRADDPCGARGYHHPWCYTDMHNTWVECCKECVNQ